MAKALAPPSKLDEESGATVNELRREFISTYVSLYGEPCFCGTHYRPELSTIDKGGNRFNTQPLESITPKCIAYWTARMSEAKHPALRARYADMVWDLSHKATGNRLPIEAARIAIERYTEAMTTHPTRPEKVSP